MIRIILFRLDFMISNLDFVKWHHSVTVPLPQLDVEAAGWKGHGITRFQLSPVDRLLVLDKAAFSSSSSYWTLCGRKEN